MMDLGMDPKEDFWPIYQAMLNVQGTSQDSCRPIIPPENDNRLLQWGETNGKTEELMATPKSIAIAGYHRVFEDGPDLSRTGSAAGSSDHSEEYSDSEMYTTDILDEDGKPALSRATMSNGTGQSLAQSRKDMRPRHSFGDRASRNLSRQCSIRMRPVKRKYHESSSLQGAKDLRSGWLLTYATGLPAAHGVASHPLGA
jgi:hypothetical protein